MRLLSGQNYKGGSIIERSLMLKNFLGIFRQKVFQRGAISIKLRRRMAKAVMQERAADFRTDLLRQTHEKTLIFSQHSSTFYLIFIFSEDDEVIKQSKL